MAKRTGPTEPPRPAKLLISRSAAKAQLQNRIEQGEKLLASAVPSNPLAAALDAGDGAYGRWNSFNHDMLRRIFSANDYEREYDFACYAAASYAPRFRGNREPDWRAKFQAKLDCLRSILDRLELIEEPVTAVAGSADELAAPVGAAPTTRKVFVVHGHDNTAEVEVARFLEKAGFQPVILHEKPSGGRTIIEKLEHYADVGFAVVILTPDDIGGDRRTPPESQKPRARQNVIGELFYFMGSLGRSHVCALKKGELDFPSDILGVVYTDMDSRGAWKSDLLKELEGVGYEIDWRKALL